MPAYIVMGAQWGDEGKGKIVDVLAEKMDVVIRFQGGANAGHTVLHGNTKYVTHLIPSGIISGKSLNIIGNGCVACPYTLRDEINTLKSQGVLFTPENFVISSAAHMVLPVHKFLDKALNDKIGTTQRGIGPAYTDKAQRSGIRWESVLKGNFEVLYLEHLEYIGKSSALVNDDEMEKLKAELPGLLKVLTILRPYIRDARPLLAEALQAGKKVLYEGAQGTFLDIDHGTYPFVTSSNTSIGGAYTGSGVFVDFDKRIGIVKSYTTRVGEGPFPTELFDRTGALLREKGNEYGATTGRPRRCGWLDLALLKQSCLINGFNYMVLSKVSCLSGIGNLKVATEYDAAGNPEYTELPGWNEDIEGCTNLEQLPQNCRNYIRFVEDFLGVPIGIVSTGPDRENIIVKNPLLT